MGWDGFATRDGENVEKDWHHGHRELQPELCDPILKAAFEQAAEKVRELDGADNLDWLLCVGALDCSWFAEALETATGMECWGADLSAEQVQKYLAVADWSKVTVPHQSARLFLETCAQHNLGMRFSW